MNPLEIAGLWLHGHEAIQAFEYNPHAGGAAKISAGEALRLRRGERHGNEAGAASGTAPAIRLQEVFHPVALFEQLGLGGLHAFAAEVADLQALDDLPAAVLAAHREGIHDPFRHAVA